jgi:hypothetical protein
MHINVHELVSNNISKTMHGSNIKFTSKNRIPGVFHNDIKCYKLRIKFHTECGMKV